MEICKGAPIIEAGFADVIGAPWEEGAQVSMKQPDDNASLIYSKGNEMKE